MPPRAGPAASQRGGASPTESGLRSLGGRTAVVTRTGAIIVGGALALPGAPAAGPAAAAVAIALCGCAIYWRGVVTARRPRWLFTDLVIVSGQCVALHWTVAPEMLDGGAGWVRNLASVSVMAYQWHTRPLAGAGFAVTVVAAYSAGALISPHDTWSATLPRVPQMLAEVALARGVWMLVLRGARRADEVRRAEESVRLHSAVTAATRADEREYLATLHDTAATTLLLIGQAVRGVHKSRLAEQAGRDMRILTGRPAADAGRVNLIDQLDRTIRTSPLDINWVPGGPLWMPAGPATMICRGVNEALANVAAHSGVEMATVRVERHDNGVLIEVIDKGRGFEAERVPAHRRGLPLSIAERMAAIGGAASITSRPGAGTRVRLVWSLADWRSTVTSTPERRGLARSAAVTVDEFLRGIRLAGFAIVMALLVSWELPLLILHAETYDSIVVQLWAFGGQALVAAAAGVRVLRHRSTRRWGPPLMVLALGAVVMASSGIPPEAAGTAAHWTHGNAGWLGLLLLMTEAPAWVLLAFPVVEYVLTLVGLVLGGHAGFGQVAFLTTASVVIWVTQFAAVASTSTLRRVAEVAARTAFREERLRTGEVVSERIHRDRQTRYAALCTSVIPLLNGLSTGELDPGDPRVQNACAVEAARLRRLIAERDQVPDPLVHELEACIDVAERRGMTVTLVTRGRLPRLSREVRRALIEPALGALMSAATTARVTVFGLPSSVTLSVVADSGGSAVDRTILNRNDTVTVSEITVGERVWVQVKWSAQDRSR